MLLHTSPQLANDVVGSFGPGRVQKTSSRPDRVGKTIVIKITEMEVHVMQGRVCEILYFCFSLEYKTVINLSLAWRIPEKEHRLLFMSFRYVSGGTFGFLSSTSVIRRKILWTLQNPKVY
jgi:hypothetical protein